MTDLLITIFPPPLFDRIRLISGYRRPPARRLIYLYTAPIYTTGSSVCPCARVCPGSPRCLFTGATPLSVKRHFRSVTFEQ